MTGKPHSPPPSCCPFLGDQSFPVASKKCNPRGWSVKYSDFSSQIITREIFGWRRLRAKWGRSRHLTARPSVRPLKVLIARLNMHPCVDPLAFSACWVRRPRGFSSFNMRTLARMRIPTLLRPAIFQSNYALRTEETLRLH